MSTEELKRAVQALPKGKDLSVVMESHSTKCRYRVIGAHWDEKEKAFVIEVSFARA